MVPVPKKDGKVRMCVDCHDLNKANHKDDFSLAHIDVLVDNIVGHVMLSFMDGFSGYNYQDGFRGYGKDFIHYTMGDLLLQGHAIRVEECRCHLSMNDYHFVAQHDTQRG